MHVHWKDPSRQPRPFEGSCPACALKLRAPILHARNELPVQSCLQPETAGNARAIERRPLELVGCRGCGLVFNRAFDPATQRYDQGYEETQAFSAVFREFSDRLVDELVERWRPQGATVVEIGCGKGDFLEALCRQGGCSGIGIDPAFEPGRRSSVPGVRFERRLFSADDIGRRADFLICRHTLEHIGPVGEFLARVAEFCRQGGVRELFFEVPDAGRIVAEGAFWDVYYEHANYFSLGAFEAAFQYAGMTVTESSRLFYGQYLGLFARTEPVAKPPGESVPDAVESWATLEQQRSHWQGVIETSPAPIVIWGSGSKGVAFLTGADAEGRIEAAIDINPHRQGRFMPGTGQPIVAPEALVGLQPATVIIMNPAYEAEIGKRLAELDLDPRIELVGAKR